jgi:dimeric dUTPase (all-alpha-NTP-PPase superfamily)
LEYVVKVNLGGSANIETTNITDFHAYFVSLNELMIISEKDQIIQLYDGLGRKINQYPIVSGKNSIKSPVSSGLLFLEGEAGTRQRLIQP